MFFRSALLAGGLAGGAVLAGLVLAGRSLIARLRGSTPLSVPMLASLPVTVTAEQGWEADALDDVARMDALHDMGTAVELDFDARADPEELAEAERGRTVETVAHAVLPDEPYDALDAEDLGTEWLFRATETNGPSNPAPSELLDGMHEIDSSELEGDDPRESDELHTPPNPPDAFNAPRRASSR